MLNIMLVIGVHHAVILLTSTSFPALYPNEKKSAPREVPFLSI